jgi:hypothetical protein
MMAVAGGGDAQSCQFPRAAVESLLVAAVMGSKEKSHFPSLPVALLLPLVLRCVCVPTPRMRLGAFASTPSM